MELDCDWCGYEEAIASYEVIHEVRGAVVDRSFEVCSTCKDDCVLDGEKDPDVITVLVETLDRVPAAA